MIAEEVKWIQIEATTKCNAWCPGCPRNINGFDLAPELIIEDLSSHRLQEIMAQYPNADTFDFCGSYGDAIAAANIIELTKIVLTKAKKVIIRTNGSLRTIEWWRSYAQLLSNVNHEVWFCLDGLEDTHSIYRQATDFNTIIENACAFMSAGGVAVWQFIPWQHNQHQIKECIKLSQQLGFTRFEFIKNVRANFQARHYQTGKPLDIKTWKHDQQLNKLVGTKTHVKSQNCQHLTQSSIYVNANGSISNCCFLNLRLAANSLRELPNIAEELPKNPRSTCLRACGSP